jgi:hypothetical protein
MAGRQRIEALTKIPPGMIEHMPTLPAIEDASRRQRERDRRWEQNNNIRQHDPLSDPYRPEYNPSDNPNEHQEKSLG